MKRLLAALAFAAVVVVALVLTTGGDEPESAVPALTVTRMEDDTPYELTQLASAEKPTLLWFWAPWCPVCNAEAPKIEQMAAESGEELAVVAIGGRDDAANGPAFVEEHDLRSPMLLFDEPMAAWEAYAIPGQPVAVLLDREGHERRRWHGPFDPAEALTAARAL